MGTIRHEGGSRLAKAHREALNSFQLRSFSLALFAALSLILAARILVGNIGPAFNGAVLVAALFVFFVSWHQAYVSMKSDYMRLHTPRTPVVRSLVDLDDEVTETAMRDKKGRIWDVILRQ